ncbi:hypothetical protein DH2020_022707 [Rehmannia glutinosa]|uniref:DUF3444 domain-containing protein n=1 Tax=Rehmannia glutinosa TaxID=99300 RepID=A0ABR0W5Q6_REHGL
MSITVPDSDFHDFDQDRSEECFKPKQIWALYDEEDGMPAWRRPVGGCVRIYPRSGDIWAVYRNWSPDWDRTTPDEVRHQYEMVEEGVWVTPLIKLDGYKTVYQRNANTSAIRWIPRREMLRFSHQVPSCSLNVEGTNLPEGCWDLDPAATPDELLQGENDELHNNINPGCTEKRFCKITESPPDKKSSAERKGESEENLSQSEIFVPTPAKGPQIGNEACVDKKISMKLLHSDGSTIARV